MLSRMDEFGRPAWVLATVAAFWLFWPLGVATLAYLAWTGRLASGSSATTWSGCAAPGTKRSSTASWQSAGGPALRVKRSRPSRRRICLPTLFQIETSWVSPRPNLGAGCSVLTECLRLQPCNTLRRSSLARHRQGNRDARFRHR